MDSCPLLNSLGFNIENCPYSESSLRIETRISYQELAILKGLPNLKNFEFTHFNPVSLTNEELEALVSSWTSLETFYLTIDCRDTPSVSLTLACLLPLAQHCPNLRKLGLYMDARVPVNLPKVFKPFKRLEELHVGASPIKNPHKVSIFLSNLCPTEFHLEQESKWSLLRLFEKNASRKRHNYRTLWKQVPVLIRACIN